MLGEGGRPSRDEKKKIENKAAKHTGWSAIRLERRKKGEVN